MRIVLAAVFVASFACAGSVAAKPSGTSSGRASHPAAGHRAPAIHAPRSNTKVTASHPQSRTKALGVQRDTKGRIARDLTQKAKFERSHPCPSTGKRSGACPGYVIDHVRPLKRGGADRAENMQWQTKQAAKQKDKSE